MKKVFIVHGFHGQPNGGWRPWLMGELGKRNVYACSLSMPNPEKPVLGEWMAEIARHVERNSTDELYLVGHSLGVATILRYLETAPSTNSVAGAVLVSGPCEPIDDAEIRDFLSVSFDFTTIKSRIGKRVVIHGDNDDVVPIAQAKKLARELDARLAIVENGGHLNGSSGWYSLPECLGALLNMMEVT